VQKILAELLPRGRRPWCHLQFKSPTVQGISRRFSSSCCIAIYAH
jgi:hypothetical protein